MNFIADKFGILVQNDILRQCNTEPFARCEQFQQFGGMTVPSWDTALQATSLCYKRVTNILIFNNLYPRSTPPRRRDVLFYIVLNISKNLRIPNLFDG